MAILDTYSSNEEFSLCGSKVIYPECDQCRRSILRIPHLLAPPASVRVVGGVRLSTLRHSPDLILSVCFLWLGLVFTECALAPLVTSQPLTCHTIVTKQTRLR